jgi:hypothetical protein
LNYFLKVVSVREYKSGNCGSESSWEKEAEYKFRAIADGSVAAIGETDR